MTEADLKPLRGHYVHMSWGVRRSLAWAREQGVIRWGDWESKDAKGILGIQMSGIPMLDGCPIAYGHDEWSVESCDLVFKVPKKSIRVLCQSCMESHPLGSALKTMRLDGDQRYAERDVCSVCPNIKRGWFTKVPSRFWKYSALQSYEEIEKDLFNDITWRLFADCNAELVLMNVERVTVKPPHQYRCKWHVRGAGEQFTSEHDEPPSALWWERYVEVSELRQQSLVIKAGNGKELFVGGEHR